MKNAIAEDNRKNSHDPDGNKLPLNLILDQQLPGFHLCTMENEFSAFATQFQIDSIDQATEICMDGTFNFSSIKGDPQLLIFSGDVNGRHIPLLFLFVWGKSAQDYTLALQTTFIFLKRRNKNLSTKHFVFVVDFERAERTSLEMVFPGCTILCDHFHLFKNVNKNLKHRGLESSGLYQEIKKLTYAESEQEFKARWENIKMLCEDRTKENKNYGAFWTYFCRQYSENKEAWAVAFRGPDHKSAGTSKAESINNTLKTDIIKDLNSTSTVLRLSRLLFKWSEDLKEQICDLSQHAEYLKEHKRKRSKLSEYQEQPNDWESNKLQKTTVEPVTAPASQKASGPRCYFCNLQTAEKCTFRLCKQHCLKLPEPCHYKGHKDKSISVSEIKQIFEELIANKSTVSFTYFSRNDNFHASKRAVKLSQAIPKLPNNNDHVEEYFAAFDLEDDTQNEKSWKYSRIWPNKDDIEVSAGQLLSERDRIVKPQDEMTVEMHGNIDFSSSPSKISAPTSISESVNRTANNNAENDFGSQEIAPSSQRNRRPSSKFQNFYTFEDDSNPSSQQNSQSIHPENIE